VKKKYIVTSAGERAGCGKAGSEYVPRSGDLNPYSKHKVAIMGANGVERWDQAELLIHRQMVVESYNVTAKAVESFTTRFAKAFTHRSEETKPATDNQGRAYNTQTGWEYINQSDRWKHEIISDHQGPVPQGDVDW